MTTNEINNNGDETFLRDLVIDAFKSRFRNKTFQELMRDGALIPGKTGNFKRRTNTLSGSVMSRMLRVVRQFPPSLQGSCQNNDGESFSTNLLVDALESYFRDATAKELAQDGALIFEKTDDFARRSNALSGSISNRMLRILRQFLRPSSPQGSSKQ